MDAISDSDSDQENGQEGGKFENEHKHHTHVHHGECCSHDHSDEIKIYNLPVLTKLASCDAFRVEGHAYFKETQYARARARFQKILVYLDYTFPTNEDEEQRAAKIKRIALLNMALCSIRLKEYREAISLSNQIIREWPSTPKALFYRGRARRLLGEFADAKADLIACKRLIPTNPEVSLEIHRAEVDERLYEMDAEVMAKGMFSASKDSGVSGSPTLSSKTKLMYL